MKGEQEFVESFRAQVLKRRALTSLKLYRAMIHSKADYSRRFAVFTAWKMHVKESRLLSKYLAESSTNNFHTVSYQSSKDPMAVSRMRTVGGTADRYDAKR